MADLTSVFVDPTAYADEERFHAAYRVLRREHPVDRAAQVVTTSFPGAAPASIAACASTI
jgi:hypothetical protein